MGRVYLARSPGGRQVAVKVIRPQLAEDAGFRARFAREVSAWSKEFHPPSFTRDPKTLVKLRSFLSARLA